MKPFSDRSILQNRTALLLVLLGLLSSTLMGQVQTWEMVDDVADHAHQPDPRGAAGQR